MELTLAIGIGMMVGSMSLALLNQQTAFLKIFRAQDFLTVEAPVISNYLGRVIGQAEGYRLHTDFSDAVARSSPVLENASALALRFQEADGVIREAILAFHNPGSGAGIYYYLVLPDGSVGAPQWALSTKVANAVFSIEEGILRVRLDGPNGEEVVYSGAQQL
jgi:hypothetical protein